MNAICPVCQSPLHDGGWCDECRAAELRAEKLSKAILGQGSLGWMYKPVSQIDHQGAPK